MFRRKSFNSLLSVVQADPCGHFVYIPLGLHVFFISERLKQKFSISVSLAMVLKIPGMKIQSTPVVFGTSMIVSKMTESGWIQVRT